MKNFSHIGYNDQATMNYIKLKIFVGVLLIHLIDQICCETNTLEGKYETGREILLSITIKHDNVTSFFIKIQKEYDNLSNIFKDENDKSIMSFVELSKKQAVMEVNNLAQKLNKLSLDEQLKYDDFFRSNIEIFKTNMTIVDNCLKNNDLMNKILRCIDRHQNLKSNTNKAENKFYESIKNLLGTYNSIIISKIKVAEKKFLTAANKIISIAKNNNEELIKRKSRINVTSSTNKKDQPLVHSISGTQVNETLKNFYNYQKKILNTANLLNWIVIQSMSSNMTLNHISKMNQVNEHDKKNVECCFDYSKVQLDKAENIAVSESNKCVEDEMVNLENLVSLRNQEAEKIFLTCFFKSTRLDDIFECMGWLQPFESIPKTLKLNYNEALKKFNNNKEFLTSRIFDCSYKSRDYFNQRLKHLNNQFDNCVQHQKSSDKCIEPTSDNFMPITLPPNTQIIELDFVTVKP